MRPSGEFDFTDEKGAENTEPPAKALLSFEDKRKLTEHLGFDIEQNTEGDVVTEHGEKLVNIPGGRDTLLKIVRQKIDNLDVRINKLTLERTRKRDLPQGEVPANLLKESLYPNVSLEDSLQESDNEQKKREENLRKSWQKEKISVPVSHPKDLLKSDLSESLEKVSGLQAHPAVAKNRREYYAGYSDAPELSSFGDDPEIQRLYAERSAWLDKKIDLLDPGA